MTIDIHFKYIHKLAIPALISGVAEPLLSTTDLAIVGNIQENATESIAAIGIVGAFLSMLIWVFGQTRSGISSIVSQYVGAQKEQDIKYLPAQAIFIILITALVILLLSYPFARDIFTFYNATDLVLDFSVDYYKIRVLGFPFTLFTIAVFGTFRGLQNTYYPMIIALIGTVVNVILDIILVYGIDGLIPAMNIKGAAWASVLAQLCMAVIAAILLLRKTHISLKVTFPFHDEIPRFLTMILNLFIRTIALNVALFFGTNFAASYGTNHIAAYTIGFNIWLTGAFMIDGYSSAGNILAGKLLGGRHYKTLLDLGKTLIIYGFLFGLSLALIGFALYKPIGHIFTKEAEVLNVFYKTFWLILIMQPFCAVAFIFDGIFKGLGEMGYLRNVLLLSTAFVFIPMLLILDRFDYKLYAIWVAFFAWIVARGLPLILKFRIKFTALASST